jgi:hypothetical protein
MSAKQQQAQGWRQLWQLLFCGHFARGRSSKQQQQDKSRRTEAGAAPAAAADA